ncbi:hypothetical protein [Arthrobacter sp. TMN-50]
METDSSPNKKSRTGPKAWIVVLGLVLTAVLATINWLQLASIERALGGQTLPEARLLGYDVEDIEAVRALMTDELLERYGASHYLWDTLFPLVFSATLILLIFKIARGRKLRWVYAAVPTLYAIVDIAENLALEALFGSATVTTQTVAFASTLTALKAGMFILSLITALITLGTRPRQLTGE